MSFAPFTAVSKYHTHPQSHREVRTSSPPFADPASHQIDGQRPRLPTERTRPCNLPGANAAQTFSRQRVALYDKQHRAGPNRERRAPGRAAARARQARHKTPALRQGSPGEGRGGEDVARLPNECTDTPAGHAGGRSKVTASGRGRPPTSRMC